MPYIKKEQREAIDEAIENLLSTPGSLNYCITRLCHDYIENFGLNYNTINEVIGVLSCVKASLIETVYIPYEKIKMKENGHISDLDKKYYENL